MFGFRFSVLQMTISLVMSVLSGLLLEQKWQAGILLVVAGAIGILLLSIAIVFAERIERRLRRGKKSYGRRKRR